LRDDSLANNAFVFAASSDLESHIYKFNLEAFVNFPFLRRPHPCDDGFFHDVENIKQLLPALPVFELSILMATGFAKLKTSQSFAVLLPWTSQASFEAGPIVHPLYLRRI
jgi:hypothetical protein